MLTTKGYFFISFLPSIHLFTGKLNNFFFIYLQNTSTSNIFEPVPRMLLASHMYFPIDIHVACGKKSLLKVSFVCICTSSLVKGSSLNFHVISGTGRPWYVHSIETVLFSLTVVFPERSFTTGTSTTKSNK